MIVLKNQYLYIQHGTVVHAVSSIFMISIKKVIHIWRSEIKQIGQCIKRSPMNIDCNLTTVICILGQTFNKSAVRIVKKHAFQEF